LPTSKIELEKNPSGFFDCNFLPTSKSELEKNVSKYFELQDLPLYQDRAGE
jgi:hypothetical protein